MTERCQYRNPLDGYCVWGAVCLCKQQAARGQPDDYSFADDFAKSIDFAYDHIRKRKAAGGKGWRE